MRVSRMSIVQRAEIAEHRRMAKGRANNIYRVYATNVYRLGTRTPITLFTNNRSEVVRFIEEHIELGDALDLFMGHNEDEVKIYNVTSTVNELTQHYNLDRMEAITKILGVADKRRRQ